MRVISCLVKTALATCVIFTLFAAWQEWNILWSGKKYKNENISMTFPYFCESTNPNQSYDVNFKKIMEIPYQVISCRIPEYTYEEDGVIPADFYSLKIFNENDSTKLDSLGLSDQASKIKPELIIQKILLPLENYQILHFKIIENKPITKNSLNGYYIKAKLNRKERGEFFVEAIIYYHPLKKQFYVLSTYQEYMDSGVKERSRFFNSFNIH